MSEYDSMIEIEDILIDGLSDVHEVDGHDIGANETNIFIHTDNPSFAFDEAKALLRTRAEWINVQAAYRDFSEDDFTVLWPKGLKNFNVA